MSELDKIIEIVHSHYQNGDNSPEIIQSIQSFVSDLGNLEKCKQILQMKGLGDHIIAFISNSFRAIIQNFIDMILPQDAFSLIDWMKQLLIQDSDHINKYILNDFSISIAIILRKFWKTQTEECWRHIGNLSLLFNNAPQHWYIALTIYNIIIESFSEEDDLSAAKIFSGNALISIFLSSYEAASKAVNLVPSEDDNEQQQFKFILISESCKVISKCLSFKHKKLTLIDRELKNKVSDIQFINFFFEIYSHFLIPESLDVITSILGMPKNSFISNNFVGVVNNICEHFIDIIQNKIGFDPNNVFHISLIIGKLSKKIDLQIISQIQCFSNLIDTTTFFTQYIIENISNASNSLSKVFKFWDSIAKVLKQQKSSELKTFCDPKIHDIYEIYVKFLLHEAEASEDLNNLDLLTPKLSPLISIINNLISFNAIQAFNSLTSYFQNLKNQFFQLVHSNNQNVLIVQKQLAVIVQIMIFILIGSRDEISISAFSSLLSLLNETADLLQNSVLFPELETSLLIFIFHQKNTMFGNKTVLRTNNLNSLYQKLHLNFQISSYQDCQDFYFNRIFITLDKFFQFPEIINFAISIISESLMPSPALINSFLDQLLKQSFLFNIKYKQRSDFFTALMNILMNHNNQLLYDKMFSVLQVEFDNLLGTQEINTFVNVIIDITGLFNAKFSLKFNSEIYLLLFNWLFPSRVDTIIQVLPSITSIDIYMLLLKMCRSLVSWTPTKRINFPPSSANGVILFKFTSTFISQFFSILISQKDNEEFLENKGYKGLRYTTMILEYLITGDFVPFDAFRIYNDDVFIRILQQLSQVFSVLNIESILYHPKVYRSVSHLFKAISVKQLRILCAEDSPEEVKKIVNTILIYASKGVFDTSNDTVSDSLQSFDSILQFLIEENETLESDILKRYIDGDILNKGIICIWQYLFSTNETNAPSKAAFSLNAFITINPQSYEYVKQKIISSSSQFIQPNVISAFTDFEERMNSTQEISEVSILLKKLKEKIKANIPTVSLLE